VVIHLLSVSEDYENLAEIQNSAGAELGRKIILSLSISSSLFCCEMICYGPGNRLSDMRGHLKINKQGGGLFGYAAISGNWQQSGHIGCMLVSIPHINRGN
jgi:hypothetical protein